MGNKMQFLTENLVEDYSSLMIYDDATPISLNEDSKMFDYKYNQVSKPVGWGAINPVYIYIDLGYRIRFNKVFLLNQCAGSGDIYYGIGNYSTLYNSWSGSTDKDIYLRNYTGDADAYMEADRIRIKFDNIQSGFSKFQLGMFLVCSTLFELNVNPVDISIKDKASIMITSNNTSNKKKVTKFDEDTRELTLDFHRVINSTDEANLNAIEQIRCPFLLNVCGDTEGSITGWNWGDLRRYILTKSHSYKFSNEYEGGGISKRFVCEECGR